MPEPPDDRHFIQGYHRVPVSAACSVIAHAKKHDRVVNSCIAGHDRTDAYYILRIQDTFGKDIGTISHTEIRSGPKPFVFQTDKVFNLYFPSRLELARIRQVDVLAGTMSDRKVLLLPNVLYAGAYVNPEAGCIIISTTKSASYPTVYKLSVYRFDPQSAEPIDARGEAAITFEGEDFSLDNVDPNKSLVSCAMDHAGQPVLYISYADWRAKKGAPPGSSIKRLSSEGTSTIATSRGLFWFLQQKVPNTVYAVNDREHFITKIDTASGAVERIGQVSEGAWYDFDPSSNVGLLSVPVPKIKLAGGEVDAAYVCPADINSGNCVDEAQRFLAPIGQWNPNLSSGGAGDGMIFGFSAEVVKDIDKSNGDVNMINAHVKVFWY